MRHKGTSSRELLGKVSLPLREREREREREKEKDEERERLISQ